ncbi:putative phosphatidate phosphatase [Melitaea cinxia]|uniref:putative phosphatidate phosphatase n=1 Tax=Melitaea cinxia TaxID=113334 RepID=UPI001E270797|nr:putative phosphatidate phosphatase [Melitaea cinxia]
MLNKLKFAWSKTNRFHRVIFIFLLVELKLFPGGKVGFQCNDPALSHPFTGDTVNWKWLIGVTTFLPLVVMLIIEKQKDKTDLAKKKALLWYKEYLYGYMINLTLVQCLKFIVGSPRPHFFDTCSPKEALTCEESEYVSSYTCTKAHWLNQSDRSFPSGHTSLAFHAGIFIIYYLHQRANHINTRTIRLIQLFCCVATLHCTITRLTDHRHHWWDVLAGMVVAAGILIYTILRLCKNFECLTPKENIESQNAENLVQNTNTLHNARQTKVIENIEQ